MSLDFIVMWCGIEEKVFIFFVFYFCREEVRKKIRRRFLFFLRCVFSVVGFSLGYRFCFYLREVLWDSVFR